MDRQNRTDIQMDNPTACNIISYDVGIDTVQVKITGQNEKIHVFYEAVDSKFDIKI